MDIQQAINKGYYFDRCIDLTFYNTDMDPIAYLKTPKMGLKPTITIKGTFIEGGYSIDSYISIQNMAFDIDVAYIGFIKAKMYYSGLNENKSDSWAGQKTKSGHVVLYRVLYADQEKEPPSRCVRFQCVVASKDITMFQSNMYVNGGGIKYLLKGQDAESLVTVSNNKTNTEAPLVNVCKELIQVYNAGVKQNTKAGKSSEYYDLMKITTLEIDEPLENLKVELPPGKYTIGEFIRLMNSTVTETSSSGISCNRFKIVIDRGTMRVSTPVPSEWKQIARAEGIPDGDLDEYYNSNYISVKTSTYDMSKGVPIKEQIPYVVPLNFVKSATRSECVVYVETLFDDRITPGCHVSIKSNAIMGKKFGSSKSKTGGSRILNYLDNDEPIIFRNTGKIDYVFSTTDECYMKLQGPVDESVEAQNWAKNLGGYEE